MIGMQEQERSWQKDEQLKPNLNDTATIRMGRQGNNLSKKGWDNKLDPILWDTLNTFLDYMITILVTDTFHNRTIKLCHHSCLLLHINHFQGLNQ